MTKVKKNSFIILLLTLLLLAFMMRKDYKNIIYYLINSNKLFLLIGIIMFFISILIDAVSFQLIIKNYKIDYPFKKTVRLNLMTKFFNGITPLSTGGQPLQLYELYKDKVKLNEATNIVIQFFIIYQIGIVVLSTIVVILNNIYHIFAKNMIISKLVMVGYIINFAVLIVLFYISFNKKFNVKTSTFIITILSKLKIVKNKENLIKNWEIKCENFYNSAQIFRKKPIILIRGVILQIIQLLFLYTVPFFVSISINDYSNINLFKCIAASSYVYIIGGFIPIPGATGGIEFSYMKLFSNFLKKRSLYSATILWRFITYYLPVIVGGVIFNFKGEDNIIKNKKS